MRVKTILIFLLLGGAATGGWFLGRQTGSNPGTSVATERKVLFYQSPMHPWIKSDKPGNCTICGMKLVAVFEGDQPIEEIGGATVRLSASSVSVLNVETVAARMQTLERTLRVAGTIDDDDTRHRRMSAYVEGRIEQLGVRYIGAEVREGQLLAKLYSPKLLTARDEYLLAARQPASPQRDRLLAAARERLTRLGLSHEQVAKLPAQTDLPDYLEILAPLSGTVVSRNVYEGQYVKEGDVLFEIADFSKMWFVFNVYERDLAWVTPGQTIEVSSPAIPGKTFTAEIDFIDPNLDPVTRSAKARVILENQLISEDGKQRRELLHKIYADGVIHVETSPVLAVPRSAVLSPGSVPIAYVAEGPGNYEPRRLKLGRSGDNVWEVLQGLQEGESVVTTGNLLIDAQAQLDHGTGAGDHAHSNLSSGLASEHKTHSAGMEGQLTADRRNAAFTLISAADKIAEALSTDDLAGFNAGIAALHPAAVAVASAFGKEADWVTSTAYLSTTSDLASARKDFYPFSKAVAEFAHRLRQTDPSFASVRIFECPMVKDAVPNAPERKGRWVQLRDKIQNPFFGAEMLDCGVEVKP